MFAILFILFSRVFRFELLVVEGLGHARQSPIIVFLDRSSIQKNYYWTLSTSADEY